MNCDGRTTHRDEVGSRSVLLSVVAIAGVIIASVWLIGNCLLELVDPTARAAASQSGLPLFSWSSAAFLVLVSVFTAGTWSTLRRQAAAKKSLRESEQRFRLLADYTTDWEYWIDPQGEIACMSPSCRELTGYSSEAFIQCPALLDEVMTLCDEEFEEEAYGVAFSDATDSVRQLARVISADGSVRHVEKVVREIFDGDGKPIGQRVSIRDITERIEAQEALANREKHYDFAIRSANAFSWEWYPDRQLLILSPHVFALTEFLPQELVDIQDFLQRVSPGDREAVGKWFIDFVADTGDHEHNEAVEEGFYVDATPRHGSIEFRFRVKNGEERWLHTDCQVSGDHRVGIAYDITERKQAVAELCRTHFAVDHSTDEVYFTDSTGRVIFANKSAAAQTEYTPEELVGMRVRDLCSSECEDWFSQVQDRSEEAARVESIHRRKDGSTYPVESSIAMLQVDGQSLICAVVHDITDRKRSEAALIKAKESAEAATVAKSEFLARMSHEIRTPMNGIMSMTEILYRKGVEEEATKVIRDSARSLLGLLNNILDFSKIEAGRLTIVSAPFDLRKLVEQTVSLYQQTASEKGLIISASFGPGVPQTVSGDELRLRQILNNLVCNALKFTGEGRIDVRVTRPKGNSTIGIEVCDTGIGMTDEQLQRVFLAFEQASNSTTRRYGGTGLGLAICKSLAELMGGTLSAVSEEGRGSSFFLSVPLPTATPRPGTTSGETSGGSKKTIEPIGAKLLLAEDNIVNQKTFGVLATQILGCELTMVSNGREAVEAGKAGTFDMIFMDCHMPEMDGLEAAKILSEHFKTTGRSTPIIALTADILPEMQRQCAESGMTDFATKPFDFDHIENLVRKHYLEGVFSENTPRETACSSDIHPVDADSFSPNTVMPDVSTPTVDGGVAVDLSTARLLEIAIGDKRMAVELGRDTLQCCQKNIDIIQRAIEDADSSVCRQAAHTIKGAAANAGAQRLSTVAAAMQGLAEDGELSQAADLLRTIRDVLDDFENAVVEFQRACEVVGP